MNKEQHDILYSRARVVLNHNVKRLWFKINPFLERKRTLKGKPELETKFVQPLQSAVLCEKFFVWEGDQSARDSRNIPLDKFWDFLYSEEWSHGCSVRVLEGELLDELLYWLHICVLDKYATTHKTFAFARNTRERRGCYKLANQKGCGEIQETLLLEFTYYGRRLIPPLSSDGRSTWSYYPDSTSSGMPYMRSSTTESDEEIGKEKSKESSFLPPISEQSSDFHLSDDASKVSNDPYTASQPIEIIPKLFKLPRNASNASSDDSTKATLFRDNLAKFRCTERIGSEFSEEVECTEEHAIDDESFGEEFYLTDTLGDTFNKQQSTCAKLQRNKETLAKKREDRRIDQKLREFYKKQRKLPPMPDFDIEKIKPEPNAKSTFQFAFLVTKVPSFEEFLNILDVDERFDPRYKRSKQISKKIAKRYNLTKDALNKRNLEMIDMNSDVKKRFNILQKLPIFARKMNPSSPDEASSNKSGTGLRSTSATPSQSKKNLAKISEHLYTERFAAEVGGVTDSKECENHVLRQTPKKTTTGKRKKKKPKHPDVVLTSPSGNLSYIVGKPKPNFLKSKVQLRGRSSVGKKDSVAERRRLSISATKYPSSISTESSSSSEESDFEDTVFDSTKLNRKYSLEKVKGKNYRRKKPAFYEILKKYYRTQRVLDLFTGKSPSPDKKVKRKSIFQRLMEQNIANEPREAMILGKMKKFRFLTVKPKGKAVEEEHADFTAVNRNVFLEKLKQSLDDFVVRREHVVSDYKGKTSTTLTFTRKGVFTKHKGQK